MCVKLCISVQLIRPCMCLYILRGCAYVNIGMCAQSCFQRLLLLDNKLIRDLRLCHCRVKILYSYVLYLTKKAPTLSF